MVDQFQTPHSPSEIRVSTVSLGGTASRHSGFACLFTISMPFSHLAPTCRQRPHLLAAGVARATGYRE